MKLNRRPPTRPRCKKCKIFFEPSDPDRKRILCLQCAEEAWPEAKGSQEKESGESVCSGCGGSLQSVESDRPSELCVECSEQLRLEANLRDPRESEDGSC
jgi:hypothetical protein